MPISTHRTRTAAVIAALLTFGFALVACSAGVSDPSRGSAPPKSSQSQTQHGSAGEASGGSAGYQAARDAYDLKLAQCLRDAGFDVQDPQPGQGISESGPEIRDAAAACMREIGAPPRPDAKIDEVEALNTMLEWADCFRERGVDVQEPERGQAFILPDNVTDDDVAACIPPL